MLALERGECQAGGRDKLMSEKPANSDKTTRWVAEASNMIRMVVEVAKIGWCRPVPSPEKKT